MRKKNCKNVNNRMLRRLYWEFEYVFKIYFGPCSWDVPMELARHVLALRQNPSSKMRNKLKCDYVNEKCVRINYFNQV